MIAEGPNAIMHDGTIFLIYSGSLVGIDYTTGLVTAPAGQGADLTDASVWTKLDYPLQKSGMYNGRWQLGTGHGMWSHDEDGNLIYVFHNAEYENGRYGGRDAQVRRVHWSKEGMPILDMQTARNSTRLCWCNNGGWFRNAELSPLDDKRGIYAEANGGKRRACRDHA